MEEEEIIIPEETIDYNFMRYELNDDGYILNVYFGCYTGTCIGYEGDIPSGYDTLIEWHDTQIIENKLNAWKIVDGNLVFDEARYNELETRCAIEEEENTPATRKYVNDKVKVSSNVVTDELAVEKTGNSLVVIDDTGNYNIPELKVTSENVDRFKVVSSNKNMLANETITTTINGVDITNNGDGTITLDGTSTDAIEVNLNGSNTNTEMLYLINKDIEYGISGLTLNVSLSLYSYDGMDRTLVINNGNGNFTLANSFVVTQTTLNIPSGVTFREVVISPQLEMGKVTSFVKHEETSAKGTLYKNKCTIDSLNSYEEKTIIMIDKEVTTSVKYYKYQYLNEKLLEIEATSEEVKSTMTEIDNTVEKQDQKISEISQRVGEINSKISEIADVTTSRESINAKVTLEEINESEPIYIKIHPTGENISYLYPRETLFPSDNLFIKTRTLRFKNTETNEVKDYEIPNDLLYYDEENYDEFILDYEMQSCAINKKVGCNFDGTTYLLETPIITEYEYPRIPLTSGNYEVSLLGYTNAYIFVRLMATNIYTTQFATKVEVKSQITQLSNEINAEVKQKVNEDEIIAKINLAVKDEQGIIDITGNQVKITSDNFTLDANGTITTKAGVIGGLRMTQNSNNNSFLYKNYTDEYGSEYQSGLYIPNAGDGTAPFLYAGCPIGSTLASSNLYIRHNGLIKAKWFEVNGENGYFHINYNNGRRALTFDKEGMFFFTDNETQNNYFSLSKTSNGMKMAFHDGYNFSIFNAIHGRQMAYMQRYAPELGEDDYISFNTSVFITGTRLCNGLPSTIYIQGYEVATNASDERIKKNIVDSEVKALELINKIHHKSFDWDKEKTYREGHIDCGYIAQELIEIDPNFVIYNEEFDTYQINVLYVLATSTKAIQELNEKIEKRDKIIEFLAEKLNCKDEVLEMLKEGD